MVAGVQAAFGGEHLVNVVFNQCAEALQHGERQVFQPAACLFGVAHGLGDGFVAVAEGQAFFDQVVRQIGGGGEALQHGGAHGFGFHGDAAHHVGINPQRVDKRVHGVEERFFVFLIVFVIRQRLGFHQHYQAGEVADDAAGFAAHEFGHVGVFLLRHDA